ncbi:MAG: hypothetical protein DWH96_09255 [Planctomycetota bacterium]|nr:MAG: hypothetical protein DWH96_09255 [Planctomycetota bacterium]RLS91446.1 MAG: hypothetical protein DWI11_11185 [Planctomycetota bacterium]
MLVALGADGAEDFVHLFEGVGGVVEGAVDGFDGSFVEGEGDIVAPGFADLRPCGEEIFVCA